MSNTNIEIEAKVLLKKTDYDTLVKELNFPEERIKQTNYYFDSKNRVLKKYGMILRIRYCNKQYVLTMKAPLSEGLLEKNQNLSDKEAENLIDHNIFPEGDVANFLDMLQINTDQLIVLATLTTARRRVHYINGTTLDISQNTYGDKVDFELECDSDTSIKSQSTLKEICAKYKIHYALNKQSKEERAISNALK
jgi:uncharacterized protein YjbK